MASTVDHRVVRDRRYRRDPTPPMATQTEAHINLMIRVEAMTTVDDRNPTGVYVQ